MGRGGRGCGVITGHMTGVNFSMFEDLEAHGTVFIVSYNYVESLFTNIHVCETLYLFEFSFFFVLPHL